MGDLITSGDTINNFGKFLPTPYIKKAYLSNSTDDNQIIVDVDLEIYIRAYENTDITTLLNSMVDLRLYVALNFDGFPSESDYDDEIPMDIDELLNNEQSVWDFYFASDWYGACAGGAYTNYGLSKYVTLSELNTDDDWSTLYTIVYDDEGNRTAKLSFSLQIDSSAKTYGGACANFEWVDPYPVNVDIYLFSWIVAPDSIPEDDTEYKALNPYAKRFLNLETSEIAYEQIWSGEDASIPGTAIDVWLDSDGNLYDDAPIQSLTSLWYTNAGITHSDIVALFKALLEAYKTLAETDSDLQEIMNQVSYILETKATAPSLLVQLGLLSRVFPSKSSATNVGKLYLQFKNSVHAVNISVESGKLITKNVVTNSKVVDNTILETLEFEWPTDINNREALADEGPVLASSIDSAAPWTALPVDDYTYDYGGDMSTHFVDGLLLSVSLIPGEVMAAPTAGSDVACFYGWAFFDYDKALYETAAIGDYLDIGTLIELIGEEQLVKYFQVTHAAVARIDTGTYDAFVRDAAYLPDYDQNYGSTVAVIKDGYKTTLCAVGGSSMNQYTGEDNAPSITDIYGNTAYSFLLLRNFASAESEAFTEQTEEYLFARPDRRLMGFEFQYFGELGARSYEINDTYGRPVLWFGVKADDTTMQLLADLKSLYETAQAELATYVELAEEACAKLASTGYFADGFIETQTALYDGDEESAPWNYYPIFYVIFVTLYTNSRSFIADVSGVTIEMQEEAQRIATQIGPEIGTLEELQSFQSAFDSFYDTFMVADGDDESIGSITEAAVEYGGNAPGSSREDSTEIVFSNYKSYDELVPLCTDTLGVGAVGDLGYYAYGPEMMTEADGGFVTALAYTVAGDDTVGPCITSMVVDSWDEDDVGEDATGTWEWPAERPYLSWPDEVTVPTSGTRIVFKITFNEALYVELSDGFYSLLVENLLPDGQLTSFGDPVTEGRGMGAGDIASPGNSWFYIKDMSAAGGLKYSGLYDEDDYTVKLTFDGEDMVVGTTYGLYFDPSPHQHDPDEDVEEFWGPPITDANGNIANNDTIELLFEFTATEET